MDTELLRCSSFHSIVDCDHRLVRIRINLEKPKVKMTGYWRELHDQLLLMLQQELTGALVRNMWLDRIKSKIMSFAVHYSRQLNRVRLAEQTAYEEKFDRRLNPVIVGT